MPVRVLYSILPNNDVIIVKNGKEIFNGTSDNIPIVLMNEWVYSVKVGHEDLVIIL